MKMYAPADRSFSVNTKIFAERKENEEIKKEDAPVLAAVSVLSWIVFLAGAALSIVRTCYPGMI